MKKFLLAATAVLFVTQANAVTMTIQFERPDCCVGVLNTVATATDPVTGTLHSDFTSGLWDVSATLWAASTSDLYGTVNAFLPFPYDGSAISIYMTLSNITSPFGAPVTFHNSFTFGFPDGVNWLVNSTTYFNNFYLDPPTLHQVTGTYVFDTTFNPPSAPYSLTQFYGFQAAPVTVPAPIAGAGIPGLAALAMLWLARRRRQA